MTDAAPGTAGGAHQADDADEPGHDAGPVRFGTAKGFSRGYDHHEVDTYFAHIQAVVHQLEGELGAAHAEIAALRDRIERDSRSAEVKHAISVLTTAQTTADGTVAQADQYSARVMAAAKDLYDDTRRNTAILEQETEAKARAVFEDAMARAAAVEHESEQRIAALTVDANIAQQRLDGQTAYLRTLRDATRTQMETFLEGLLDHLAGEYGQAHPAAAKAASGPVTPAPSARRAADSATVGRFSARHPARRLRATSPSIPRPRYSRSAEMGSGAPIAR